MASMTVADLKERLEDYGDHLQVKVVLELGADEVVQDFEVTEQTVDGEPAVVLTVYTEGETPADDSEAAPV